jgi:hypothetical protein
MATRREERAARLFKDGAPRWIRAYDNGGETGDRYTVVYTHLQGKVERGWCQYVGMSAHPFHPQGFGQHGEAPRAIDTNKSGFAPAIGRTCHLGKRIAFTDLPPDCRKLVVQDYREFWNLNA